MCSSKIELNTLLKLLHKTNILIKFITQSLYCKNIKYFNYYKQIDNNAYFECCFYLEFKCVRSSTNLLNKSSQEFKISSVHKATKKSGFV